MTSVRTSRSAITFAVVRPFSVRRSECRNRLGDHSLRLSPFDPLLFGMLGARAFAHVRLGQFERGMGAQAAARPSAHAHILAIAAHCRLGLTGRIEEGQAFTASIRQTLPQYCSEDFTRDAFRFAPDVAALFRFAAGRVGLA